MYEVVGGFGLLVDSCTALAGCPDDVFVDPADITNAGGAAPVEPFGGATIERHHPRGHFDIDLLDRRQRMPQRSSKLDDGRRGGCRNDRRDRRMPDDSSRTIFQSLVARKGSLVIRIRATPAPPVPVVTYQYSLNAGKSWLSEPIKGAPMIVVRYLASNRSYEVAVRAIGAKGAGTASKPLLAKTP